MDDITKDKRFRHIVTDPRFKKVPKSEYKVKIDKRFQSMFTDKRFQLNYVVDKRGRPVNETQSDNFKKYYDLESEDEEDGESDNDNGESDNDNGESDNEAGESDEGSDQSDEESDQKEEFEIDSAEEDQSEEKEGNKEKTKKPKDKVKEESKRLAKLADEMHKSRINDSVKEKLQDMSVDYARGIGTLLSESSSDEPSSDESESEFIEHAWGELDKDAEQTDEVTRRIAVCHMDWDRINAKDIMVLFHSFLPADGIIESVTIYPSEFGLARMKEEELKGPKELVDDEKSHKFEEDEFEDKHSEGSTYHREKLREYQLKRLKYYYAVIVCNSAEAANKLYSDCDGMEYESSATKIDLRFIPDDMTFEQEPKEVCSQLPDVAKYKPRLFANSALQQGTVRLTWDETDPNRIEFNKKIIKGEINDDDLQAYIAASSESEESEKDEEDDKELDPISKYKSLIAEIKEKESRKDDQEMEISWGAGLSSKMKLAHSQNSSDEESEQEEKETENKEENNKELELLLAGDDPEENNKAHFNLKDIQKIEKMENKKKKRKKNLKKLEENQDNFKVDLSDDRFSALYTSHHFNIDPADSNFKKTKGMTEFIAEKHKRRKIDDSQNVKSGGSGKLNSELSSLVNSIKRKSKT